MLFGMAVLFFRAQLFAAGSLTGAGAVTGVAAGCFVMTCISIGGADGVGVSGSLDRQQIFQMHNPTTKVQIAAAIMAAGDVKAQCGSGTCMWPSLSSRMVSSNSSLYFVRSPCTSWWMTSLLPFRKRSVSSLAQSIALMVSDSSAKIK